MRFLFVVVLALLKIGVRRKAVAVSLATFITCNAFARLFDYFYVPHKVK